MAGVVVGVDVGGTFTDVVVLKADGEVLSRVKVSSTPHDQSVGVMNGLARLQIDLTSVDAIIHGTTVATNAIIEGKSAKSALITTKGFRDVLELRNRHRPQMYGLSGTAEPIIGRDLRFEVDERLTAAGEVLQPLDTEETRRVVERAIGAGAESIAIVFLHSYANAVHEERAGEVVRAIMGEEYYVSLSSALLGEVREFERTATAATNAVLQPVMGRYLRGLSEELQFHGFRGSLRVVQSNGGVALVAAAIQQPVATLLSGPAAGVMAAVNTARQLGASDVLSLDMGGTSLDLAIVRDGRPQLCQQQEVRYGSPVRGHMIDIATVGAGGGSIAWLDDRGILSIGPRSAGAEPGPACYGRGGRSPTITDANVVLGRLAPGALLGDEHAVRLDSELAERAIEREIAAPLNLDVVSAAEAILSLTTETIVRHARKLTIARGLDPRAMAVISFGGSGPLHSAALMKALSFQKVIVPLYPGLLAAHGCAIADFRHDFVRTINAELSEPDLGARLSAIRDRDFDRGCHVLKAAGIDRANIVVEVRADCAFAQQTHSLSIDLDPLNLNSGDVRQRFVSAYSKRFRTHLDRKIEIRALRTSVIGRRYIGSQESQDESTVVNDPPSLKEKRQVWFEGSWISCPVYWRSELRLGTIVIGPALVEQPDTTIVVEPGIQGRVERGGAFVMEP